MMDIKSSKVIGEAFAAMSPHAYATVDTLIVWTESNGTDMALSFQEGEGCAAIW